MPCPKIHFIEGSTRHSFLELAVFSLQQVEREWPAPFRLTFPLSAPLTPTTAPGEHHDLLLANSNGGGGDHREKIWQREGPEIHSQKGHLSLSFD